MISGPKLEKVDIQAAQLTECPPTPSTGVPQGQGQALVQGSPGTVCPSWSVGCISLEKAGPGLPAREEATLGETRLPWVW